MRVPAVAGPRGVRRSSSSSRTWTWSASAIRRARSTRARGESTCAWRTTGCVADGTTLGADNGIGVAAALAVVDDAEIEHGPLELLFTVSEEQGLDGAKALDASLVSGRLLVNLDGTSDDALTVGCAGSDHTFLRVRARARARTSATTSCSRSSSPARRAATPAGTSPRSGQRDQGARASASPRTSSAPFRLARSPEE